MVAPLTKPYSAPATITKAVTLASLNLASSATSAPVSASDKVVDTGQIDAVGHSAPSAPPTSHAAGKANMAWRAARVPRSPANSASAITISISASETAKWAIPS